MKFIDIETSQGLSEDPDAALIAHKSRVDLVGVSELGDEDNVTVTSNFIHIPELVGPGPLCGHNVKFDIKTLVFKGIPINVNQLEHDTLLMAVASYKKVPDSYIEHYETRRRELNKGHKKGHGYRAAKKHSLKVLAPFFLNVPAFWENPETTNDEEYLKKDVRYTAMLFHFLKAELEQQGTWDFYQSKILPWARMTLQAEIDGICINVDKMAELWKKADAGVISSQKVLRAAWKEVEEEYAEKQKAEIKAQYEGMKAKALAKDTKKPRTPDQVTKVAERYDNLQSQALARVEPFNYASPSQLLWAMKDKLKYDVTDWVGEEGTGADILMRLANSGKEDIKALLEYREHNKLATSYFPTYKDLMYKGRIHCNFNIHGTKTGRLSASDPNLQQVTSDLKQLFVAAPGNKLVSLDLSAIEPALIAYYSEDQALCEILIHKDDFHGTAAVEFFELKIPANKVKQEQKSLRDAAKTSDLALFYGTGHKKLWSILRLAGLSYSLDQCKGMLERYKHKFREVYKFKYNLDQTCYSGEVIETMLGRKFRIDNMDDVYMKAFNRLVQSSASDLLLKATQDFLAEMPEARLRLLVHDNTVVEVPSHLAQKAYDRLFYHMTKFKLETKHGAIPLNAEGGINDFWE